MRFSHIHFHWARVVGAAPALLTYIVILFFIDEQLPENSRVKEMKGSYIVIFQPGGHRAIIQDIIAFLLVLYFNERNRLRDGKKFTYKHCVRPSQNFGSSLCAHGSGANGGRLCSVLIVVSPVLYIQNSSRTGGLTENKIGVWIPQQSQIYC